MEYDALCRRASRPLRYDQQRQRLELVVWYFQSDLRFTRQLRGNGDAERLDNCIGVLRRSGQSAAWSILRQRNKRHCRNAADDDADGELWVQPSDDVTVHALEHEDRTARLIFPQGPKSSTAASPGPSLVCQSSDAGGSLSADSYQFMVSTPSRSLNAFRRLRKLMPSTDCLRLSITAARTLSISSSFM